MIRQLNLNASLLDESDCLCKVNFIHNEGLVTSEATFKMDYGTSFHKFRAIYRAGGTIFDARKVAFTYYAEKCLTVPPGDFRTIDHLHQVTELYPKQFPLEQDVVKPIQENGHALLEIPFMYPLELFFDPDDFPILYEVLNRIGLKIILCGTIDEVGIKFDEICIVDCKVTARWDKEKVVDGFRLAVQPMFYSWVWRKLGLSNKWLPVIIDGVFIKNPTARQRDKVTGKLVKCENWTGVSFQRSEPIDFSDQIMEKFERYLLHKIFIIANTFGQNNWGENFSCCNTVYGPCDFRDICMSKNKEQTDFILSKFERRTYEPWKFQE